MPRGHEDDPVYLHQYLRALFPEKDCNGKKDRCAVFGYNDDRLFPEKYTLKFSFCPKREFQRSKEGLCLLLSGHLGQSLKD